MLNIISTLEEVQKDELASGSKDSRVTVPEIFTEFSVCILVYVSLVRSVAWTSTRKMSLCTIIQSIFDGTSGQRDNCAFSGTLWSDVEYILWRGKVYVKHISTDLSLASG